MAVNIDPASIAEALRCGGDRLAVDAVLVIGEHGDYPDNEIGQKKYPRYEFFRKVVEVFRKDGRTAPVFNDTREYWYDFDEHGTPHPGRYQPGWYSVNVPESGTRIRVVHVNRAGVMTVKVGAAR